MSMPRAIITIADTDKLPHVLQACEHVEISDLRGNAISTMTTHLKNSLFAKLPGVADTTHKLPAYLAANQIGLNKQVVLLYLPANGNKPAELIVMINPKYQMMSAYPSESQSQFRISTFLAEQFRFNNDCYAQKIIVHCYDQNWKQRELVLENTAAVAAQMGINFVYGITPLDHNISQQALLAFANGSEKEKIILTKKAYELHGRDAEINNDFQFGNSQVEHISGYVKLRNQFEVKHNPRTGNLLSEEQNTPNLRTSMTL